MVLAPRHVVANVVDMYEGITRNGTQSIISHRQLVSRKQKTTSLTSRVRAFRFRNDTTESLISIPAFQGAATVSLSQHSAASFSSVCNSHCIFVPITY